MARRKKVYETVEELLDAMPAEDRMRLYWALMLELGLKQMDQVDLGKQVSGAASW